jgi:hypothetical protein
MATECLSDVTSNRSKDDRDNLRLLLVRLICFAAMAMGLFAIVAPFFIGMPAPPRIDHYAYMVIGALGMSIHNLFGEQQRRVRELERLLKDHRTHAVPRAASGGG